jgi:hypothetical protein
MKEPVDHILRPNLPWRAPAAITECGLNAKSVKTLSRDEFFARLKDMGQQRTALLTCMTCSDTARRWGTWEDDPRRAVEREIQWEGSGPWRRKDRGDLLRDELLAIAAVLEAHRDEFEGHLQATVQRRAWLEQKAALAAAKTKSKSDTRGRSL